MAKHRPGRVSPASVSQRTKRNEPITGGDLGKAMLVRIAHHERNAIEGGDLLGSALRIASGDEDAGRRVGAMNAADGRTRILIGGRGDGAGVQYNEFGFRRRAGSRQTAIGQLALNRRAVGLGGATSEVFYKETAHGSIIWALGVVPTPAPLFLIGKDFCLRVRSTRTMAGSS